MEVADWMKTMEQLQDSIHQTAAEITRHEQALASPLLVTDLSAERHTSWLRALESIGDRMQEFQTRIEQAEQDARDAESALAGHETEMVHFRDKLGRIGAQLANRRSGV